MTDSLEGGYNYQFVKEPPDSLKCLICLSVVKEPQQHAGCGKLFCKVCIDHYKLQSRNDCPYCRKPLASLFPDIRGEHTQHNKYKSVEKSHFNMAQVLSINLLIC